MCLGTFLIVTTRGEDAPGISWVEARAAAEDCMVHQAVPTMRNCPASNVNSSEVEKPWPRAMPSSLLIPESSLETCLSFWTEEQGTLRTKMEQEDLFLYHYIPHGLRGQHYQHLLNKGHSSLTNAPTTDRRKVQIPWIEAIKTREEHLVCLLPGGADAGINISQLAFDTDEGLSP